MLDLKWRGHTTTKWTKLRDEEAVRVFRFTKRKKLSQEAQADIVSDFEDPESPDDVIVLFKMNISSSNYSGKPTVCLPHCRLKRLAEGNPPVALRAEFSVDTLREFEKTASVIEKRPWSMNKAAAFLRNMCEQNKKGELGCPPDITRVWNAKHYIPRDTVSVISIPESLTPVQLVKHLN